MADTRPADTAHVTKKRGRPSGTPGSCHDRARTVKIDLQEGVAQFCDLAMQKHDMACKWDWDGRLYPKMKRSQGPHQASLAEHSPVLEILLRLAPNGYPDSYRLHDILLHL